MLNYRKWMGLAVILLFLLAGMAGARAQATNPAVKLSLAEAIELALRHNVQAVIAEEGVAQAKGTRGISLSALLPNLSAAAAQSNLTSNLAALGMPLDALPGLPPLAGPFNRFDARFQLTQSVFDLAAIRRYQAGGRAVELARERQQLTTQTVTAAAAIAYLAVLEAEQNVNAAQSNTQLAETLRTLAEHQRSAGVAAGIDVARAETRLANQKVQLARAQTVLDDARLDLLRVVYGVSGLPSAETVELSDALRFTVEPVPDAGEAVQMALADRAEVAMAERELQVAELQRKAATAGRLPTFSVFGDYGSSGLTPEDTNIPTRSVGVQMNLPIFSGGRTQAEIRIAASRRRESSARLEDVRAEVAKDVRQALLNVRTFADQVRAAELAISLAERELELAEDRFKNGVADNTEVVTAQTALEDARRVFVSSLAGFNIARLNLASAMGHAEQFRL
ncbi:MAG: TolC family protein [Acidobacteriota bacterium]|jgi:outer membrane protein TolC|nr:TolC family protein [Acidobacteriota bacterium]